MMDYREAKRLVMASAWQALYEFAHDEEKEKAEMHEAFAVLGLEEEEEYK